MEPHSLTSLALPVIETVEGGLATADNQQHKEPRTPCA